jgi:hypothetical protein
MGVFGADLFTVMCSFTMTIINRFSRSVMIAVCNDCGITRLHVSIYNVINACALFQRMRARTRLETTHPNPSSPHSPLN